MSSVVDFSIGYPESRACLAVQAASFKRTTAYSQTFAHVVGNVVKIGAATGSAIRQIGDAVKARRVAVPRIEAPTFPTHLEKAFSEKSIEYLKKLAASPPAATDVPTTADINSHSAGSGLKTIKLNCARGLFLGRK